MTDIAFGQDSNILAAKASAKCLVCMINQVMELDHSWIINLIADDVSAVDRIVAVVKDIQFQTGLRRDALEILTYVFLKGGDLVASKLPQLKVVFGDGEQDLRSLYVAVDLDLEQIFGERASEDLREKSRIA